MSRLYSLMVVLAWSGCRVALAETCTSLERADWVLADWVSAEGPTESWHRAGARTFEGAGTSGPGSEALRLVEMSGQVFYIAKVAHNELPVAFKLVECSDALLVFVNPAHDFPRRLEYRRTAADAMTVAVSDGGDRGFEIHFRKVGR